MRRIVAIMFILFTGVSSPYVIQYLTKEGAIDFSLDVIAVYSLPEETQKVRLYCEIPHRSLLFTRTDSTYSAYFQITAIAYDEEGNQVGGDVKRASYAVTSYEMTLQRTEDVRDSLDFRLPEGKYGMKVVIQDLHSANQGVSTMRLEVPRIETESVSLSELILQKDGILTLQQDFDPHDEVTVRYQIYNLPLLSGYTLKAVMRSEDSEVAVGDSRPILAESLNTGEWKLDLSQLSGTDCELALLIIAQDGQLVEERSKSIRIETSPFVDDQYFRESVDQLRYIATTEEMKRLREAEPTEREAAWESFWNEKDPTPSTETNELKDEYYQRIEYANTHYGGSIEKGWKSDRGKTYIVYGPPDEIERHPYDPYSVPYEIWYYYGRGLRFVFVDEHGIGDYRLLSPRGERW